MKNSNAVRFLQTLEDHNVVQSVSKLPIIVDLITRSDSTVHTDEPSVHDLNLFDVHGNSLCDHHSIKAVLSLQKNKAHCKGNYFPEMEKKLISVSYQRTSFNYIPNENSFIA